MGPHDFDWGLGRLFKHIALDSSLAFGRNPFDRFFLRECLEEIEAAAKSGKLDIVAQRICYSKVVNGGTIYYHDSGILMVHFSEDTRIDLVSLLGETPFGARILAGDVPSWLYSCARCRKSQAKKIWPPIRWWKKLSDETRPSRQVVYWRERAANDGFHITGGPGFAGGAEIKFVDN